MTLESMVPIVDWWCLCKGKWETVDNPVGHLLLYCYVAKELAIVNCFSLIYLFIFLCLYQGRKAKELRMHENQLKNIIHIIDKQYENQYKPFGSKSSQQIINCIIEVVV